MSPTPPSTKSGPEWLAWQLENAGYHVLIQAWDFVPGSHWTSWMEQGIRNATRTLAVLSHAYLDSVYGRHEWEGAFRADPQGFSRRLLPGRIEDCPRPGLLGSVVSFDVFDLPATKASTHLLEQVKVALTGRAKPPGEPLFPGPAFPAPEAGAEPLPTQPAPAYPGPTSASTTPSTPPVTPPATPPARSSASDPDRRKRTDHSISVKQPVSLRTIVPRNRLRVRSEASMMTVAVNPAGDLVATGSTDDKVRVWETAGGRRRYVLYGAGTSFGLDFSPDGRWLACAGHHEAQLWNVMTGRLHQRMGAGADDVSFAPRGDALAVAGSDDLSMWPVPDGTRPSWRLTGIGPTRVVGFHPENQWVAVVGGRDGAQAMLRDSQSGDVVHQFGAPAPGRFQWFHELPAVAVSPDSRLLAYASSAGAVEIFETASGELVSEVRNRYKAAAVVFRPGDPSSVFTAGEGGAHQWDTASGQLRRELTTANVYKMSCSPNGHWLAVTLSHGHSRTVELYDFAADNLVSVASSGGDGPRVQREQPAVRGSAVPGLDRSRGWRGTPI